MAITDTDYVVQPLEQLRPRLVQLVHSLNKLEESIRVIPIPKELNQIETNKSQVTSIQNQITVIIQQLSSLAKALDEWWPVLDTIVVYPNNEFDVMNNVNLLLTLLRKKLTPEVEKWISNAESISVLDSNQDIATLLEKDDKVVEEIIEYVQESINNFVFTGYLTADELERGVNVSDVVKLDPQSSLPSPSSTNDASDLTQNDLMRFIHQGIDSGIIG